MPPKGLPKGSPEGQVGAKMAPGGLPGGLWEPLGRRDRILKGSGGDLEGTGGRFWSPCWAQKLQKSVLKSKAKANNHWKSHFDLSRGLREPMLAPFWYHFGLIFGGPGPTAEFMKISLPLQREQHFQGFRPPKWLPGEPNSPQNGSWRPPRGALGAPGPRRPDFDGLGGRFGGRRGAFLDAMLGPKITKIGL